MDAPCACCHYWPGAEIDNTCSGPVYISPTRISIRIDFPDGWPCEEVTRGEEGGGGGGGRYMMGHGGLQVACLWTRTDNMDTPHQGGGGEGGRIRDTLSRPNDGMKGHLRST